MFQFNKFQCFKIIAILGVVALVPTTCSDKKPSGDGNANNSGHAQAGQDPAAKTKVVDKDGIQFAFDLMPTAELNKMLKSMGIKVGSNKDANYGLILTLIDKTSSDIIKKANVQIVLTEDGTGKKLKPPTKILAGGGMYHYGAHVKLPAKGKWTVRASAKVNGKKVSAKTKFHL